MKNNLITSALVAILGFALIGVTSTASAQTPVPSTTAAPAAAPTAATAPKTKAKSDKTPYKGTITAIDASSVTVSGKENLTLAITPTTKFAVDKKKSTAADFAVGDAVTGSYSKDATGAMSAASLHKKSTKTAKAATTTPAAQ